MLSNTGHTSRCDIFQTSCFPVPNIKHNDGKGPDLPFAHVHHCHYPPSSRLFKLDSERDKTNKNVQKSRNDSLFQMFIPFHSFTQFPFSENTTQRASSQTSIILHKSNKTLSHFSGTQHPVPKLARFRRHPNQTPRERFHGTTHVFPLRPLF